MTDLGRGFRTVLSAQAVSSVGDGLAIVAMPLLATTFTRDPVLVAGAAVAQGLPWLLLSLPAGVFVDRMDRRRLMVAADATRAVVLLAFGLLLLTGVLSDVTGLVALYVVGFLLTTAEVVYSSAAQSLTPQVVEEDDLETANGRIESTVITGQEFVGPALGGVLFAAATAAPFLLDALTFAASAALLLRLRGRFTPAPDVEREATRRNLRAEVAEGLRFVASSPPLRLLVLVLAVAAALQGGLWALLALYARDVLEVPVAAFGLLWALASMGDLAGGLVVGRLKAVFSPGQLTTAALLVVGAGYLVMGLVPAVAGFVVALAAVGFAIVIANVVLLSFRQRLTPDHLLGRVSSVFRLASAGCDAIGALLGGLVAAGFGLRAPFVIAGAIQIAVALAVAPLLVRRLASPSKATASTDAEPTQSSGTSTGSTPKVD